MIFIAVHSGEEFEKHAIPTYHTRSMGTLA